MRKYRGISLIETLISLTIVGISLIALLPVVTIRKDSMDASMGNNFWSSSTKTGYVNSSGTSPVTFYSTPKNVTVGIDEQADTSFWVYNRGFANSQILPLKINERLNWNNTIVEAIDGLRIASGAVTERGSLERSYQRTVFVNDNIVTLENFYADSGNYSYNPLNNKSGERDSNNYYSISNGDEYLVVDTDNEVIGIGKNAARFYPGNENFIAILNNNNYITGSSSAVDSSLSEMMGNKGGLIIGVNNKIGTNNTYGTHNGFVIYRPNDDAFYINANLSVPMYKASAVIISSDKRLKTVLDNYDKSINEVLKVKPVTYAYKKDNNNTQHVGVIAQDLQKVFPEAVSKGDDGYLMITEDPLFYALLNSIKKLDEKNYSLKKQNDELEKKVMNLREIKAKLEASMGGANE